MLVVLTGNGDAGGDTYMHAAPRSNFIRPQSCRPRTVQQRPAAHSSSGSHRRTTTSVCIPQMQHSNSAAGEELHVARARRRIGFSTQNVSSRSTATRPRSCFKRTIQLDEPPCSTVEGSLPTAYTPGEDHSQTRFQTAKSSFGCSASAMSTARSNVVDGMPLQQQTLETKYAIHNGKAGKGCSQVKNTYQGKSTRVVSITNRIPSSSNARQRCQRSYEGPGNANKSGRVAVIEHVADSLDLGSLLINSMRKSSLRP